MLLETEKLHSKVRRYTSPEEHPFYASYLPSPILPELSYPQQILLTGKSAVDVNSEVMRWYVGKIIDRLCVSGKGLLRIRIRSSNMVGLGLYDRTAMQNSYANPNLS
jgi:hypothetical protein